MPERPVRKNHESGREIVLFDLYDFTNSERAQLISSASSILDKNGPLQRKLGERFNLFKKAVAVLLTGRSLYVDELESLGLGTERVLNQTRSLIRNYNVKKREMQNRGPSELGFDVRGGTDPFEFLGDNSGGKGLGYIQGDPGERD